MIWGALLLWCAQGEGAGGAQALWNAGRRGEAIEGWRRALDATPQDRALRGRLVEALLATHRYAAALEEARGLGAEAAAARGLALCRLGRHAEALRELPRDDERSLLLRIDAAEALGLFEESDAALDALQARVGALDPRVPALLGRRFARREEFERAAQEFERALAFDPCDPIALFSMGKALLKLGRRDEALRYMAEHRRVTPLLDQLDFAQRAVDLAPAHAANVASVGDAERALGRIDRAERAYAEAARLAGPDEATPIALRRARLLVEDKKDVRAAVRLLDEAAQHVRDPRLLVRAGDLLLQLDDKREAALRFERALELRPDDAEIRKRVDAAR